MLRTINNCTGSADATTKSGEIYVVLRSGKHDVSTATAHHEDFLALCDDDELNDVLRDKDGKAKGILVVYGHGGPDENVRFIKTICCRAQLFIQLQLDASIACMIAPEISCYKEAERTESHLNEFMNGCAFDAFQCGNTLNSAGQSINNDVELVNFEQVMIDLCNLFNQQQIDGFPVKCIYKQPQKHKQA